MKEAKLKDFLNKVTNDFKNLDDKMLEFKKTSNGSAYYFYNIEFLEIYKQFSMLYGECSVLFKKMINLV